MAERSLLIPSYVDNKTVNNISEAPIETHPFKPFIPEGARILIMGTFPPQPKRWAMDFYYPNRTNDFWRIMGLIFFGDADRLYDPALKKFNEMAIKELLERKKIAMSDTGYRIRRLKGNASDKFLEIVEPAHLSELLAMMPDCKAIATTGEKAADVLATLTSTEPPKIGEYVMFEDIEIWRMPSTSRAYPLPLAQKALPYEKMFKNIGIL